MCVWIPTWEHLTATQGSLLGRCWRAGHDGRLLSGEETGESVTRLMALSTRPLCTPPPRPLCQWARAMILTSQGGEGMLTVSIVWTPALYLLHLCNGGKARYLWSFTCVCPAGAMILLSGWGSTLTSRIVGISTNSPSPSSPPPPPHTH